MDNRDTSAGSAAHNPGGAKSPTVSVVIPTFNRERWLPRSVGSVQAQSLRDWELLVVDDGSTDGSAELLEAMAAEDPRIRPMKNLRTKGVSGARNTGIDAARGEYIAFLDSDDEWLRHHLERSIQSLNASLAAGIAANAFTARAERRQWATRELFEQVRKAPPTLGVPSNGVGILDHLKVLDDYLTARGILEIQTLVVRRSSLDDIRFPEDLRMGEDGFFHVQCLRRGVKFLASREIHVTMWAHDANTTAAGGRVITPDQRIQMHEQLVAFGHKLLSLPLTPAQQRAVKSNMAMECFWQIGFHGHLAAGRTREAFQYFRKAICLSPRLLSLYRSYCVLGIKCSLKKWRAAR